ncbi:MAG: HupE/UreJ family protein [Rhizobiaceae bacterium]|nr:HupE/UreJ family protein [Rhizobiaceae bacterium]
MRIAMRTGILTVAAALAPTLAHAHTGVGSTSGYMHGFSHPIGGLDHVLAMVAVGVFAAFLGGRALWLVPAAFVAMMAVGGVLGIEGVAVPFVEAGIAASVVVLGLTIAFRWSPPTAFAMALVGVFAIFHGHAHGAEMPLDASGLSYAIGFMLATALLHIAGIALGFGVGRIGQRTPFAVQAGGGTMALVGVAMLGGLI